jgi:hypothetical protein
VSKYFESDSDFRFEGIFEKKCLLKENPEKEFPSAQNLDLPFSTFAEIFFQI